MELTSAHSDGKAKLHEENTPGKKVTFALNPTQISYSRSVKFNREPKESSTNDPPVQFKGTQATALQLQVLLDAVGQNPADGGVQADLDRLVEWTTVPPNSTTSASTPRLVFSWGELKIGNATTFPCFLEDLKVTVEMFARNGTPLRASVTLSLKSDFVGPDGTNPTSGSESSRRRRVLQRGQSLQSLAYDEYGDAGAWRAVAEMNGIDDPTRLRPGQEVLLPDRRELVVVRS